MLKELLTTTDPNNYQNYLNEKTAHVLNLIKDKGITLPSPQIFPSTPSNYRMRAEFAVFHTEDTGFEYCMYDKENGKKKRVFITYFDGVSLAINKAMALLKEYAITDFQIKNRLFEADFLCNLQGDVIITLNYHKKLDEAFAASLEKLRSFLHNKSLNAEIVARARKQKITCKDDTLLECLNVNGKNVYLYQIEGTFTQPNAVTCEKMLEFALSCSLGMQNTDLLELYCGSGTFTATLAPYYRKVLATEVARVPTQNALRNLEKNNIGNVKLVRLSAVEVTQALNRERTFNRLQQQDIDLNEYAFKTLLIDPPRAGLQDEAALKFTARFDRVIYISCGPESFASDLQFLTKTHRVEKLAFFDQFPYTHHLESGALLVRR